MQLVQHSAVLLIVVCPILECIINVGLSLFADDVCTTNVHAGNDPQGIEMDHNIVDKALETQFAHVNKSQNRGKSDAAFALWSSSTQIYSHAHTLL